MRVLASSLAACVGLLCSAAAAESNPSPIVRFQPIRGEALEVWRITHNPAVRDYANYHNMQCWSPDGRYVCFTHYATDERESGPDRAAEIHLFDLAEQRDVLVERGINPRWANRQPWLFYSTFEDGPRHDRGAPVIWLDVASGRRTRIGYGMGRPMGTDCGDRWLYGIWSPEEGPPRAIRIAIAEDSPREVLPGDWSVGYNSLNVNPTKPIIVSRDHNYANMYYATPGTQDIPFKARHFIDHDLDGKQRTGPFPIMEGAHFAWSGDGEYFLPGNGPLRGRKWNEPLPSNIHFLANISVGDVCPCGFSGRWICGSTGGGTGALRLADIRSGEGREVLPTHSFLCFPSGRDNSGPYDIDAKGSPDGTKIAFLSTYDLQHGPAAQIVAGSSGDEVRVDSTDGFPESGRLVNPAGFGGEVLSYSKKTPTSFQGLTRGLYGTDGKAPFRTDRMLVSFDSLLLPAEQRKPMPLPARWMREIIKDMDSPLMWQRQTDIYVAVVRRPDRPHLRRSGERVELVPGENHWETRGYRILQNGRPLQDTLLLSNEALHLTAAGSYTAVAVEWSGLESLPSLSLDVGAPMSLTVLVDAPADFQWTLDRWLTPDGKPVAADDGRKAVAAVCEVVHLHDGVIQRQQWRTGRLSSQDDLNPDGRPIRRLTFEDGRLVRREYLERDGRLVSTEFFDAEGFITRSVGPAQAEWDYERAQPVRYRRGSVSFAKESDRWVRNP